MTTAGIHSKTPPASDAFILPDAPLSQDEKMTNARHLSETGQHHHLVQYLGSPETTIVSSERYVVAQRSSSMAGSHYPDLLVAFDADPAAYEARNGYIIEEQGKPPDFVLEVASRSTRHVDTGAKRVAYARQRIPEYWRFDETGEYHGTRLAGDRLVNGRYEPIDIEELSDGSLQGYSAVLGLFLRWTHGRLGWHDPATGEHIATFESERERANAELSARIQAEARANAAEARADDAEARARYLEAEVHRLRHD